MGIGRRASIIDKCTDWVMYINVNALVSLFLLLSFHSIELVFPSIILCWSATAVLSIYIFQINDSTVSFVIYNKNTRNGESGAGWMDWWMNEWMVSFESYSFAVKDSRFIKKNASVILFMFAVALCRLKIMLQWDIWEQKAVSDWKLLGRGAYFSSKTLDLNFWRNILQTAIKFTIVVNGVVITFFTSFRDSIKLK